MSTRRGRPSFGGVAAVVGAWLAVASMAILLSATDAGTAGSAAAGVEPGEVGSDGAQATGGAFRPMLSADGRFVVFDTEAPLVAGDTNGVGDIYVRDRVTHVTDRISVAPDFSDADGPSCYASLDAVGRFVAFQS